MKQFTISKRKPTPKKKKSPLSAVKNTSAKDVSAAKRILNTAVRKILQSESGRKHAILNKQSYLIGGYVGSGAIGEDQAVKSLRKAIKERGAADIDHAYTTIGNAMEKGKLKPLHLPDDKSIFDRVLEFFKERYDLIYNEVTMSLEDNGQTVSDREGRSLYVDITREIPKFKIPEFQLLIESNEFRSYNPLKAFIRNNLHRKSEGNIEKLARSLHSPMGHDYVFLFLKRWLIGMVASIDKENYNILMLVLAGKINTGKTYFFRHLLPVEIGGYFANSKLDEGKDSQAVMCDKWLVLNDEYSGLNKIEARNFRNFISANAYTHRVPYGKKNITRMRLASVAATTNDREVIPDPENNRRVIPIEITGRDYELYDSIDKTELFIEAYHLYKKGEIWELSREEIAFLHEKTCDFEVIAPEEELLMKHFRLPTDDNEVIEDLTTTEILNYLSCHYSGRLNTNNVGKALRRKGFVSRRVKIHNTRSNKQVYAVIRNQIESDEL